MLLSQQINNLNNYNQHKEDIIITDNIEIIRHNSYYCDLSLENCCTFSFEDTFDNGININDKFLSDCIIIYLLFLFIIVGVLGLLLGIVFMSGVSSFLPPIITGGIRDGPNRQPAPPKPYPGSVPEPTINIKPTGPSSKPPRFGDPGIPRGPKR